MTNQPLDSDEVRFHYSAIDYPILAKIEKAIKVLAWICIVVVIVIIIIIAVDAVSSLEINERFDFSIFISLSILIVCFSVPLVYIHHWRKVKRHWMEGNLIAFRQTSNILRIGVFIAIADALLWLVLGVVLFGMVFLEDFQWHLLLFFAFALLLIANHALQLWFYIKTFFITRAWRKELKK